MIKIKESIRLNILNNFAQFNAIIKDMIKIAYDITFAEFNPSIPSKGKINMINLDKVDSNLQF
jgi:hypothetical protein